MFEKTMFLSKYALTAGLLEIPVKPAWDDFVYDARKSIGVASYKIGRDIHYMREDAAKAAETMRLKKIDSLRKQIKDLEVKKF